MCHSILREMYMYIQLMKQIKFTCELGVRSALHNFFVVMIMIKKVYETHLKPLEIRLKAPGPSGLGGAPRLHIHQLQICLNLKAGPLLLLAWSYFFIDTACAKSLYVVSIPWYIFAPVTGNSVWIYTNVLSKLATGLGISVVHIKTLEDAVNKQHMNRNMHELYRDTVEESDFACTV